MILSSPQSEALKRNWMNGKEHSAGLNADDREAAEGDMTLLGAWNLVNLVMQS